MSAAVTALCYLLMAIAIYYGVLYVLSTLPQRAAPKSR